MQTLYIPDKIQIEFTDKIGKPLRQDKILIGIRIFANHKNDIDLSPFLTDNNGTVIITSINIYDRYKNYISYGLMDYSSIESAKPNIEIYYWGSLKIDKYIKYWSSLLEHKTDLKQYQIWGDHLGKIQKEFAEIEKKERDELELFKNCFNRTINISKDKTLIIDNWDKPISQLDYKIIFKIK